MSENPKDIPPEEKNIVNQLHHVSIITVLAMGIAQIGKQLRGGAPPRLDFSGRDLLMTTLDISGAVMTKNWLINHNIIPATIMN